MNDICRTQERQAMALARTNDPQTSKDAAKRMVESGKLSRQEKMIYEAIRGYVRTHTKENFTTKDIARWIQWNTMPYDKAYDICRKRFSGLEDKHKIKLVWLGCDEKTGKHIYKRRDNCRVWRLV